MLPPKENGVEDVAAPKEDLPKELVPNPKLDGFPKDGAPKPEESGAGAGGGDFFTCTNPAAGSPPSHSPSSEDSLEAESSDSRA